MQRSPFLKSLASNYLFAEVKKKVEVYSKEHPDADRLISLGIGDTTHPFPEAVATGLSKVADAMGTTKGYKGYGPIQGTEALREQIAKVVYQGSITSDEITISDGIKPDLARFALLTGGKQKVAIQDPAYPVYLESSQMVGDEVILLPANKENGFFPDWCSLKGPHLLFLCYPNNPTGVAASKEQLTKIVHHARKEGMLILFDAAYKAFLNDDQLPSSIFEIEGARECAIEWGSFSKMAGFSGLRLGWCVVPKELKYPTGEFVLPDWKRVLLSTFNGASYLSQQAGLLALSEPGLAGFRTIMQGYRENALLLKEHLARKGITSFGGEHAPFLWADISPRKSWDVFEELLHQLQIVVTPGSGFGLAGEGYIRFSALCTRQDLLEALQRLNNWSFPSRVG